MKERLLKLFLSLTFLGISTLFLFHDFQLAGGASLIASFFFGWAAIYD